jgi:hypothetical protein
VKTLNLWLDDLLKAVAVLALPSALRTGVRWTSRKTRLAWQYVCGLALGALMLAVIWLTARQFRREATASGRAELADLAVGVAVMFVLFVVAQLGKDGKPPPDLSGPRLGGQ